MYPCSQNDKGQFQEVFGTNQDLGQIIGYYRKNVRFDS